MYEYLGKTVEISGCSSADETTVVETKSRKKKKNKVINVAVKVLCPQSTFNTAGVNILFYIFFISNGHFEVKKIIYFNFFFCQFIDKELNA